MICANPDKIVRKGDRILYCAGSLAERYAARGGKVLMAGKPFPPIYDLAMAEAASACAAGRFSAARCSPSAMAPKPTSGARPTMALTRCLLQMASPTRGPASPPRRPRCKALVPEARIVATVRDAGLAMKGM